MWNLRQRVPKTGNNHDIRGEIMSKKSIDMSKMTVVEGSFAVAHAVKTCRPNVISAYPITPQTHIVEDLSQMVADGEIDCQYVNVESEFSAISALVCLLYTSDAADE